MLMKPNKIRRHHNNHGFAQICAGKTRDQVRRIAKRLGIAYGEQKQKQAVSQDEVSSFGRARSDGKETSR
jgi:hypothetical protein